MKAEETQEKIEVVPIKKVLRKKVNWMSGTGHLSQIFNSGLEFAFVTKDGYQVTPFAYCKDYLQDCIAGFINNKSCSIYGYNYDKNTKHPPSIDKIRLMIANSSDHNLGKKIPKIIDFVHQIEDELKIPMKTIVKECYKPKGSTAKYAKGGVWFILGHKRWLNSPVMLSLYTSWIRMGQIHVVGDNYKTTIKNIIENKVGKKVANNNLKIVSD